ncbi:hypothetical protein AB4Y42_35875 [Paraburkholderia sp. EG286B]|uniref:hypothetical protein n=1 Tax=Paraburkholderia sp. EG286B TaxID=3237011 RepID=UPI0034D347FD
MKTSRLLLAGAAVFAAGAALQFVWALLQPESYRQFADERSLGTLPNASDVPSRATRSSKP